MLFRYAFVAVSGLWTTSNAADLLTTLRNSNASLFADTIESDPVLSAIFLGPNVQTVYAPVDSVLSSIPPSRRALYLRDEAQDKQRENSYQSGQEQSDAASDRSIPGKEIETASDIVPSRRGGRKKQVIIQDNGLREGQGEGQTNERRHPHPETPLSLKLFTGLGNSVNVLNSGISYDKGSIYTIDGLFTVPTNLSNTLASRSDTAAFGSLLNSTNLTSSLEAVTGGTFFIPSTSSLSSTNQSLTASALQGHAVADFSGYLPSLKNGQTLKTLNGGVLTVNISGGEFYINGAKIVSSNLILENGVAHVVDKVIAEQHTPATPEEFVGGASLTHRGSLGSNGIVIFSMIVTAALML
ncbi:FAS1 domain-containing protein [Massariosphaeria phaeospora]|uniref:FAS1 domain-containing protein n=1 Tax=Massariosphaeria phaeospora TaxID=100035 RepID=A0A7C8IHD9_9PLEO|nr:FAS1 domain-containing protein [Massariosphaeria phaeospora]